MLWLPPLGYSPQFAAFNLIVFAVGHHVLQHCYVVMVHKHVFISRNTAKKSFAWKNSAPYQPDGAEDSISIPIRLHTKNVSASCFQSRFDRKPQELYDPTKDTIKNQPNIANWNKKWGNRFGCPIL
ncbi:hypothetical protein [Aeromonas veronii]|uniref:hypothetical protein n=1 Tax=Aeromonas veronii TaxID=654 RepID=UPI001117936F|nr:hypothetical protein [Aeromonas veronii]